MAFHQTPKTPKLDRKDHIWIRLPGRGYKCLLCGGVVNDVRPPSYPTPETWTPDRYERLTDEERDQAPYDSQSSTSSTSY